MQTLAAVIRRERPDLLLEYEGVQIQIPPEVEQQRKGLGMDKLELHPPQPLTSEFTPHEEQNILRPAVL